MASFFILQSVCKVRHKKRWCHVYRDLSTPSILPLKQSVKHSPVAAAPEVLLVPESANNAGFEAYRWCAIGESGPPGCTKDEGGLQTSLGGA
jgi:hypothetical protein